MRALRAETERDSFPSRARWRVSALLVVAVLSVGLTASCALAVMVERQQQSHLGDVMDQRVEVIKNAVSAEAQRYVDRAADLKVAVGAQSDLNSTDFAALTETLTQGRLPGVSGAALVVPATTREIPRVQSYWRAQGNTTLRLSPSGVGTEHLFIVLNQPLDGGVSQDGTDVSQVVEASEAMLSSRATGQVTASSTYVLLKDRQLPVDERQLSFIFAAPIYAVIGTPDAGSFRGWFVLAMRATDFFGETLQTASQDTVAATLLDAPTSDREPVQVAEVSKALVVNDAGLRRSVNILVGGRIWTLQVQPTTEFSSLVGPSLSVPAGGLGALFTILLAVLVGTLSTSRDRALARVGKATMAMRADIRRRKLVENELREREAELSQMALTDSLTGLANHRAFMNRLDQAHSQATRHGTGLHVLFCDVNHFKTINDTYGHSVGDAILCQVADRLRDHFRAEDTIGRLGGDEFAIICENVTSDTQGLVERLCNLLAVPYVVDDQLIASSVSVGLATPREGERSEHLLDRADSTMYQAKEAHHST